MTTTPGEPAEPHEPHEPTAEKPESAAPPAPPAPESVTPGTLPSPPGAPPTGPGPGPPPGSAGYPPPGPGQSDSAGPAGSYYPAPQPGFNVLAILTLVFAFLVSPVGIVLGHLAKRQLRHSGEQGDALATAGLVISYVLTGIGLAACCFGGITIVAATQNV